MSSNNRNSIAGIKWYHWPHFLLSTGFGIGYWPWGPGTLAGFVGLLVWMALFQALSPLALVWATLALVVVCLLVGVWTSNVMERYWGEDSRTVIIDEFFGTWIACFAALCVEGPSYVSLSLASLGFVLFRVIDITKPLGCRWVDQHIHGGWGCMLDDALAGFYAILLTLVVRYTHLVEIVHDYLATPL